MKFPYLGLPTRRPITSLGGISTRHRPLIPIPIVGPSGSRTLDASIDSGSDDTLFPEYLASRLGIDLSVAPEGLSSAIGAAAVSYRYALVTLRLCDGYEEFIWDSIVGFVAAPMRWAVLGHAGVLQFLDVQLLGARLETILTPNSTFPGQRAILRYPGP